MTASEVWNPSRSIESAGGAAKREPRTRTLDYRIRSLGDDRLLFFEEGSTRYRALGSGRGGTGAGG